MRASSPKWFPRFSSNLVSPRFDPKLILFCPILQKQNLQQFLTCLGYRMVRVILGPNLLSYTTEFPCIFTTPINVWNKRQLNSKGFEEPCHYLPAHANAVNYMSLNNTYLYIYRHTYDIHMITKKNWFHPLTVYMQRKVFLIIILWQKR